MAKTKCPSILRDAINTELFRQGVEEDRQLELVRQIAGDAGDLARLLATEHERAVVDFAALDCGAPGERQPYVEPKRQAHVREHRPQQRGDGAHAREG